MTEHDGLRIAMIIQSYLPRLGGAEKQLAVVCRQLREKGIKTSIITRRYAGMSKFETIDGTPVYRVPAPQPKPLAALCYILFGLGKIRMIDPHILHAHELLSPSDLGILAKRLWHKPLVVKILRGGKLGDLDKLNHRSSGRIRIRRLKKNVDVFLSISREITGELALEGIERDRVRFIPNGVDEQVYKPLAKKDRERMRRKLKLPAGFMCVYSGRLAPEKGLLDLIKAWQEVVKIDSEAHLLILGSGEMEEELRVIAGKNIIFAGYVHETRPYYQVSDAFILPSKTEGLSNAMLEAMACGLAVAATSVGAAVDIIEHKVNGLLIQPGNSIEIAQALIFLLKNPQIRVTIGENGMQKIRREYSLTQTVNQLVELYEELSRSCAC